MININISVLNEDAIKIAQIIKDHGNGMGWYAIVIEEQIKEQSKLTESEE